MTTGPIVNASLSDLATVLPEMLHAAGVSHVRLETVERAPSFHGSAISVEVGRITEAARAAHRGHGFGFWEFALASAIGGDAATRRDLIRGALRHSPTPDSGTEELTLEDFAQGLCSRRWQGLAPRTMVNLHSTVRCGKDTTSQLVMLDFGIASSDPRSADAAVEALEALELGGLLFASGRSFHFVGDSTVADSELWRTLARAQLLSPLVDYRWVAHQFIDGVCRLRISTDLERDTEVHRLVRQVRRTR